MDRLPRSMRIYLLANLVLLVIGFFLIVSFQGESTVQFGITGGSYQSVGSAIFASAIVGFVYFGYMKAEKRYDHAIRMADEWGLIDIYPDRQQEDRYRPKIQDANNQIDIQAITLTRLYTDLGEELENAGKRGVKIRILLIEPGSEMCNWIEEAHGEYSDLSKKVETSVENYSSMDTDNVTVRYYSSLPINYFRIDDQAFFGPYFTEPSRNTDTMLAETHGKLVQSYRNHFEDVWTKYSSTSH